jgi:hypothetical protein
VCVCVCVRVNNAVVECELTAIKIMWHLVLTITSSSGHSSSSFLHLFESSERVVCENRVSLCCYQVCVYMRECV